MILTTSLVLRPGGDRVKPYRRCLKRPCAYASRSYCRLHHKRESLHHASGCVPPFAARAGLNIHNNREQHIKKDDF